MLVLWLRDCNVLIVYCFRRKDFTIRFLFSGILLLANIMNIVKKVIFFIKLCDYYCYAYVYVYI